MPEEKESGVEEICLGHLSPGDNTEMLRERLTLSFSLRKEKIESLEEFLERRMPKECQYAKLTPSDYAILMQMGSTNGMPMCCYCLRDEYNPNCHFYHPVHMHTYSVVPKEEPEKKAE